MRGPFGFPAPTKQVADRFGVERVGKSEVGPSGGVAPLQSAYIIIVVERPLVAGTQFWRLRLQWLNNIRSAPTLVSAGLRP